MRYAYNYIHFAYSCQLRNQKNNTCMLFAYSYIPYAYNYMQKAYTCQFNETYPKPERSSVLGLVELILRREAPKDFFTLYTIVLKNWWVLSGQFLDQADRLYSIAGITGAKGSGIRLSHHCSAKYELTA